MAGLKKSNQIVLAGLLLLVCFMVQAENKEKKPNILLIISDDLRTELTCYGTEYIKSPNIDKLAESGAMFARTYCQQAACSA